MAPIRILCVFATLNRGGAETMCMNLYRKIDRNKVQFDFVKHVDRKCDYEDEISALGGIIYKAPSYSIKNHFSYTRWWDAFLTKHPEYKVVHGHFYSISPVYFKVAHKHGLTTIAHIHSSETNVKGIKNLGKRFFISQIEKNSDACFACSEEAGNWVFRKNYEVIKNAIDTEKYKYDVSKRLAKRKELGISDDETAIAVVSSMRTVKNPFGTLEIFKAIRQKLPKAKLFWAGSGGMFDEVSAKVETDNLSDCVKILGSRGDVADIMQAADAFMLCSFSEGLPVTVIEAQASGLPCLLSDVITRDVDVTGLCSFLPITEPESWANELTEKQCQPRKDTSDSIRASGYDIAENAERFTQLYLRLAAKH